MFAVLQRGEILVPSPLLTYRSPYVRLHFQFDPDGTLTSPQTPASNMLDLAEVNYTTHDNILAANELRQKFGSLVTLDACLAALQEGPPRPAISIPQAQLVQTEQQQSAEYQRFRNSVELAKRNLAQSQQAEPPSLDVRVRTAGHPVGTDGTMKPVWIGEELVLARTVAAEGKEYVQGCWLDWPKIRQWLLKEIADLFPAADMERVVRPSEDTSLRMLAALPVRLVPDENALQPETGMSPIRASLVIAWVCVVFAAAAVCALLVGATSLSERRAAFVSAVTHELRTPLTTFRMYSEMLAEGMVPDEEKRQKYLRTLCAEADRLSHLVENVLAYARLERGRAKGAVETVSLRDIVGRTRARLEDRAQQAGMELVVDEGGTDGALEVRADISAAEQILFNLVDNACKYAKGAADARIHLEAAHSGRVAIFRIRDHGPGIPKSETRRLFLPFSKSAKQAANSAPGVGLGLALSRRLARAMGGELRLEQGPSDGACFVLSLPVV
jgi:signal transduction histidine kinase